MAKVPDSLLAKLDAAHKNKVRTRDLDIVRPEEFKAYLDRIEDVYNETIGLVDKPDWGETGAYMEYSGDAQEAKKYLDEARRLFDDGDMPRSFAHAESAMQQLHPLGYDPKDTNFILSLGEDAPRAAAAHDECSMLR